MHNLIAYQSADSIGHMSDITEKYKIAYIKGMATIILTGGGTGGHIIPNIALLPELKKRFDKIYYAGVKGSREESAATEYSIPFIAIPAIKLVRGNLLKNLKIPFVLPSCIRAAKKAIEPLNADVVFCKGGFVSIPCAYAAKSLSIPVITHESDITPGVANKLISSFACKTITSYPHTHCGKNTVFIGNPLREELFSPSDPLPYALDRSKRTILIVGGSCGAQKLNRAVWNNLDELTSRYNIIHITGKDDNPVHKGYYAVRYTRDIFGYYNASDAVISRCGAGAAGELLALRKRILFVPLQNRASRGDQYANARYYADKGLACLCNEEQLDQEPVKLIEQTLHMSRPDYRYDRTVNAKIADMCLDYAMQHSEQKRCSAKGRV